MNLTFFLNVEKIQWTLEGQMSSPFRDNLLRKIVSFRSFLFLPPFILMGLTYYNETENNFVWPLGISIIFVGFLIRLWSTKYIGRRTPSMKKKGKELVNMGPYAVVRNPLYIGNIVVATGLSVLSKLIWFTPFVFLYFFSLYHVVVLYEEKKLSERWEDGYLTYFNEVPRWIPRLRNLRGFKAVGFKWTQALRSEIPSLIYILVGILVFVLKDILDNVK